MDLRDTEEERTLWEDLPQLLKKILDYSICLCLIVLLAVFPFYHEEGYSHIGTDKFSFFSKFGVNAGKVLGIFLALYLAACLGRLMETAILKRRAGEPVRRRCRRTDKQRTARFANSPCVQKKRLWSAASVDICAFAYCGAAFLSYAFSDYKEKALWGEKSWYMGLFSQMILLGIYFFVSRFWKPRKWLFYIVFPASAAVFLMGCMNRFGIYSFGLESVGPSFISTIGNINWYCSYAVSVMFAGTVLPLVGDRMKVWQKALLLLYTAIGYLSLLLQGSDSGFAALAAAVVVMFCLSAGGQGRMLVFWLEMTILSVECLGIYLVKTHAPGRINMIGTIEDFLTGREISMAMTAVSLIALLLVWIDKKKGKCRERLYRALAWTVGVGSVCAVLGAVLLIAVNTKHPGSLGALSGNPLFIFDDAWGSHRGAAWRAGWKCFAAQDFLHKLVGVGPDCMCSYINSGSNQELYAYVAEAFGTSWLTNAHNEWLTALVNIGLLGLASYGGIITCGIWTLLKGREKSPYAAACGVCLLAYTVNNIFSFQQTISTGTIFVIFGMGMAFLRKE